ncbi:pyridoxamine 5'-phosphate oxidase family protein [Nocardioides halotolerans]|uniref:pyridoxamine 5'-phosphate oxidase family protein n=1 Tax=Nocardioides halotolerans TaxID=433660 RepID=UPI000428B243|nr:PPOX class F420-dependent oxidoreductase [Nocardioides halotolerans]
MGSNLRGSIVMDGAEVSNLVHECRTATVATIGRDGLPHLTALWFAIEDERVVFLTKTRSQKVANLRRDPRLSVLMEAGTEYDQLRGAVLEGSATLDEDPGRLRQVAVAIRHRYAEADVAEDVESSIRKRVAISVEVARVRSWDHRKIGASR